MAVTTGAEITGLVVGDNMDVIRTITGIPSGQVLTDGWLTIKENPDDPDEDAIIQKHITTDYVAGEGQITDDGETDQEGEAIFELTAANTALFQAGYRYHYDIQFKTDADKIGTLEIGTITPLQQITETDGS